MKTVVEVLAQDIGLVRLELYNYFNMRQVVKIVYEFEDTLPVINFFNHSAATNYIFNAALLRLIEER